MSIAALHENLEILLKRSQNESERELAFRYAPVILFDEREPFFPEAAGYTVFYTDNHSPSFRRDIALRGADIAIEYAIWWDWDIEHLYELEHVWVYLRDNEVIRVEASWHGDMHDMLSGPHEPLRGSHPVVYSQPGKHAFAAMPNWYDEYRAWTHRQCQTNRMAGSGGVLVPNMFAHGVHPKPVHQTLVRTYLQQLAFDPTWSFTNEFSFNQEQMVPWQSLAAWVPDRVNLWMNLLQETIEPSEYRYLRVAHRGASAYAPDNTMASFGKAVELDADMAELDIQVTSDDKLAVIHDNALRTSEGQLLQVAHHTLDELQTIDLGSGEHVPQLEDVLKFAYEARLGLYIELKDGRAPRKVAAALEKTGMRHGIVVGSFRPDWVAEFAAAAPGIPTSVLFGSIHINAVALAQSVGAQYVHPCWERKSDDPADLLTEEWMKRVRDAGLGIVCWHEERPTVISHLKQLGVDAICSNKPELL